MTVSTSPERGSVVVAPGAVRFFSFAFALSLPFDIVTLVGPFAVTTITGSALAVVLGHSLLKSIQFRAVTGNSILLLLYALAFWAFLTCVWSAAPGVAMTSAVGLALNLVTTALLLPHFFLVWRLMLTGYSLGAVYISATLIGGSGQESLLRTQFMGADENLTALALGVAVACSLGCARSYAFWPSLMFYGIAMVHAAGIAYTGSRTGLVGLIAIGAVAVSSALFAPGRGSALKRALPWLIGAAGVYGFVRLSAGGAISARLTDFSGASLSGDRARAAIVEAYLAHFDSWAVWGVGHGSDAYFLKSQSGQYLNAHGLFWKTWVELGAIGLIIYAAIGAIVVLRLGDRVPWRQEKWLLLAIIGPFALTLGGQWTAVFWFALVACLAKVPQTVVAENLESMPRISTTGPLPANSRTLR